MCGSETSEVEADAQQRNAVWFVICAARSTSASCMEDTFPSFSAKAVTRHRNMRQGSVVTQSYLPRKTKPKSLFELVATQLHSCQH
jgi:hypothetical protein